MQGSLSATRLGPQEFGTGEKTPTHSVILRTLQFQSGDYTRFAIIILGYTNLIISKFFQLYRISSLGKGVLCGEYEIIRQDVVAFEC